MTPGGLARSLLGPRRFARVARFYRAIFVDLDAVAACLPDLPRGSQVLDVGGGDGELLNRWLARRPDLRVAMIDPASSVGSALRPELGERVALHPGTSLAAYRRLGPEPPEAVLLCDVLHHVPVTERDAFFAELRALVDGRPVRVIVKEVAPGSLRSWLGWLSDRYVSGDRHVHLLGRAELRALVACHFPDLVARETPLFERDPPNYCIEFAPASDG
jgi:hypothetical protein